MKLGPQQEQAFAAVDKWLQRLDRPYFYLAGYAGTGKTTLARKLASGLRTSYAALTGKAALQMQRAKCQGASTIHSAIYVVSEDRWGRTEFILNKRSDFADADLIVIDEVSMVDDDLAADILSFGRPVLVLGDPAQLPPVKGEGYFTRNAPDFMLTEIHRQALENPIIQMASAVRSGNDLAPGTYGHSRVVAQGVLSEDDVIGADQVLCGTHRTRIAINNKFRRILGYSERGPLPQIGERLVCKQNDKKVKIFNGGLFTVVDIERPGYDEFELLVRSDDFPNRDPISVTIKCGLFNGAFDNMSDRERFDATRGTQVFDYGYALTCHAAQGSQWGNVVTYDESGTFRDHRHRWLYTALTRAADRTSIVQMKQQ